MARAQHTYWRVLFGTAITLALGSLIAALTLIPIAAGGPSGSDKLYHVLAFAALAVPLSLARPRLSGWVFCGVLAYGGAIELSQPVFGREAEWGDFMADGVGALLGVAVGGHFGRRRRNGSRRLSVVDGINSAPGSH